MSVWTAVCEMNFVPSVDPVVAGSSPVALARKWPQVEDLLLLSTQIT